MLTLILTTLIGLVFAYLATQNTQPVDLNLNGYVLTVPIYLIALGSLLIGFLVSSVVSILDSISAFFTIQSKDSKIKHTQRTVGELENRIHALELENATLRGEKGEILQREKVVEREHHPKFLDRFRHNLSAR